MKHFPVCALCFGSLICATGHAVTFDGTIGYSATRTNNLNQDPGEQVDSWYHIAQATLAAEHSTDRLDVDGRYLFERRIYNKSFDDENVLTGSASIEWRAIPNRLTFQLENQQSERTLLATDNDTPDNRQEVGYTRAFATFRQGFIASHYILLSGGFVDEDQSEVETGDSETVTGTLSYVVPLGSNDHSVSANVSVSDVTYDSSLVNDYETRTAYLVWARATDLFNTELNLGFTEFDRDDRPGTVDGFTGSLGVNWAPQRDLTLEFLVSRSIDENSDEFDRRLEDFGLQITENSALNEVFTNDLLSVSVSRLFGETNLTVGASAQKRNYEDIPRDEENIYGFLSISRPLIRNTTITLNAQYGESDFVDLDRTDDEIDATLRLDYDRSRRLSLFLEFGYIETNSTEDAADFDEFYGTIGLLFKLFGR